MMRERALSERTRNYCYSSNISEQFIFISSRPRTNISVDSSCRKRSATTNDAFIKGCYSELQSVHPVPIPEDVKAEIRNNLKAFATFFQQKCSRISMHEETQHAVVIPSSEEYIKNDLKALSMEGKYLLREAFASGSYGKVNLGQRHESEELVAIKVIPKYLLHSEEEKAAVLREVEIHSQLNHPNVVKLIETFEDKSAYYLVLERASLGDLFTALQNPVKKCNEETCRQIFYQLLNALDYIHKRGITHYDIKPKNILCYPSNGIKICDFGAAQQYHSNTNTLPFTVVSGTTGYIAPELLLHLPSGTSADIWSAGIVFFELLFGYAPFYPPSCCITEELQFPSSVTTEAVDLIKKMLVKEPSERWSAEKCMQHHWFRNLLN